MPPHIWGQGFQNCKVVNLLVKACPTMIAAVLLCKKGHGIDMSLLPHFGTNIAQSNKFSFSTSSIMNQHAFIP
eukprot:5370087-Amphidinium_carterae.1